MGGHQLPGLLPSGPGGGQVPSRTPSGLIEGTALGKVPGQPGQSRPKEELQGREMAPHTTPTPPTPFPQTMSRQGLRRVLNHPPDSSHSWEWRRLGAAPSLGGVL